MNVELARIARNAYFKDDITAWEFIHLLPETKEKWYRVAEAMTAALATPAVPEPDDFDIDAVRNQLSPSVWALQAFERILATKSRTAAQSADAVDVTPAMVKAALPWLTGWQHMNRATQAANFEEAFKAALSQSAAAGEDAS